MVAEHDAGLVEGEVVIGELAQIGEAGRDLARSARPGRHQAPDLLPDRLGNLSPGAPWPKPREAKRRRYRLDIGRQRRRTTAGGLVKKALSEDEEALRTMRRHRYPLLLPDPSPRGNDEPIRILEDQTPIGWGRPSRSAIEHMQLTAPARPPGSRGRRGRRFPSRRRCPRRLPDPT